MHFRIWSTIKIVLSVTLIGCADHHSKNNSDLTNLQSEGANALHKLGTKASKYKKFLSASRDIKSQNFLRASCEIKSPSLNPVWGPRAGIIDFLGPCLSYVKAVPAKKRKRALFSWTLSFHLESGPKNKFV